MKYLVMAALLMAGAATYAQQPVEQQALRPRTEKLTPEQKAKKLTVNLGLSADQEVKVKGLYEDQEKVADQLKAKYKGAAVREDRTALMQDLKANREQFDVKMKEVLTVEQYTKWQSAKEHRLAKGLKEGAAQARPAKQGTLSPGN